MVITDTKPLVTAALTRVSRDKQQGTSPEQQWDRAQLLTTIDGRPVLLTEEYRETQSASRFGTKERTRFAALIEHIRQNRYDLVIMWEADRGARETEVWSRFLNSCRSTGTLVHVITHGRTYDVRIGRDWRSLMEDGVDAAYFSEKLSVNVKRGHNASRDQGRPHGRAPYGYTRNYDQKTKQLKQIDGVWQQVPDDNAPTVREIITRIAAQVPINEVHRDLFDKGVNLPRSPVRAIALCPAYANLRTDGNGGYVQGRWVPIVDEATWRRAKAVLDGQAGTNPGHTVWLLSQIGDCACGATRSWKGKQAHGNVAAAYFCRVCGTKVNAQQADDHVTALAIGRMAAPDAATFLIKDTSEEANAARLEVQQLEEKLGRHRDRLEAATTAEDEEEQEEMIRRLKPRIKAAKARAEKLSTPPALADFTDALGRLDAVLDRWEAASLPARKAVLRVVFERLELHRAAHRGQPAEERITHRFA